MILTQRTNLTSHLSPFLSVENNAILPQDYSLGNMVNVFLEDLQDGKLNEKSVLRSFFNTLN